MFFYLLLIFTMLSSYGLAYRQVTLDVPYMFLERNIVLGFVVNSLTLFYFCGSGLIDYMRIMDVVSVYFACLVIPSLFFFLNYRILKPTAFLLRNYG